MADSGQITTGSWRYEDGIHEPRVAEAELRADRNEIPFSGEYGGSFDYYKGDLWPTPISWQQQARLDQLRGQRDGLSMPCRPGREPPMPVQLPSRRP